MKFSPTLLRAFVLLVIFGDVACGASITPADSGLVAIETAQQIDCVNRYAPDASATDICRTQIKNTWDTYWALHFNDGGTE